MVLLRGRHCRLRRHRRTHVRVVRHETRRGASASGQTVHPVEQREEVAVLEKKGMAA